MRAGEPPSSGRSHLLFVYGTLKRGGENHAHLQTQEFIGKGRTVAGYRLYRLDGYPGLVEDKTDVEGVVGEVWAVDDTALEALDLFEGVDEELYARVSVYLLPPFDDHRVETYLYLRDVAGRPTLDGEWPV